VVTGVQTCALPISIDSIHSLKDATVSQFCNFWLFLSVMFVTIYTYVCVYVYKCLYIYIYIYLYLYHYYCLNCQFVTHKRWIYNKTVSCSNSRKWRKERDQLLGSIITFICLLEVYTQLQARRHYLQKHSSHRNRIVWKNNRVAPNKVQYSTASHPIKYNIQALGL